MTIHTQTLPHMLSPSTESPQQGDQARVPYNTTPNTAPLPSNSLLRGQKTVQIVHNGSLYKLQTTKLGKLILTK